MKITAQNVDTGVTQTAQTDESGVYRMTNLNPGIYDITIEHPSFKTLVYSQRQEASTTSM